MKLHSSIKDFFRSIIERGINRDDAERIDWEGIRELYDVENPDIEPGSDADIWVYSLDTLDEELTRLEVSMSR